MTDTKKKDTANGEAETGQGISAALTSDEQVSHVVETLSKFGDGEDVTLDFLSRKAVGDFCRAIGFAADRNWAALPFDEIAPKNDVDTELVPEDESRSVLEAMRGMIDRGLIQPGEDEPDPTILNDFLPKGTRFKGEDCLGHLTEFQYALGVELEHGRTRGTNVTNNHPLLTGMVVMAHLTEDTLYYARLWVMETEGELTNALWEKQGFDEVHKLQVKLAAAQLHLAKRLAEKAGLAADDEETTKAADKISASK